MKYDAFSAGVEPGGLRSRDEIRILICYLLTSVGAPLSRSDILKIMQAHGLANYFEVSDALSDLTENGNVILQGEHGELCTASDTARMIAKQLESALPPVVRNKAVSAALQLLADAKRERENKVEIEKTERGCTVTCHISGGRDDLMAFVLHVPDLNQARMVKENFQRSPETVYRTLLALVTGDMNLAADLLKNSGK